MHEQVDLADVTFRENGDVDVTQLNALYRVIGWDRSNRRTAAETAEMLKVSHYYIAAHTADGVLVGFARVCGDPYVAQVLDVITPSIAIAGLRPGACVVWSRTCSAPHTLR
jgi:hypothetical protein